MLTRHQKEELVKEFEANFAKAKSVVFVNYAPKETSQAGIPVVEVTNLRKQLREEGIAYKAMKKTLLSKILKDMNISSDTEFEGQIAVAVDYEDEVRGAKILSNFAKQNESFRLTGGILEGKLLSQSEIIDLSKLPSYEELMGKLVGTIAAPISGFMNVLQGNIRGLVYALQAIADSKK